MLETLNYVLGVAQPFGLSDIIKYIGDIYVFGLTYMLGK